MLDLGLAKYRATELKPEKIWTDEISYQPEKLYTEVLLEFSSKAISEENYATFKNECVACYEPAEQLHSCYLSNPQERVDHNFDKVFQLVDFWLANETAFEKMKDKVQNYLTCSDLLKIVFFMDRLKAAEISFVNTHVFFLLILEMFNPYFNTKY